MQVWPQAGGGNHPYGVALGEADGLDFFLGERDFGDKERGLGYPVILAPAACRVAGAAAGGPGLHIAAHAYVFILFAAVAESYAHCAGQCISGVFFGAGMQQIKHWALQRRVEFQDRLFGKKSEFFASQHDAGLASGFLVCQNIEVNISQFHQAGRQHIHIAGPFAYPAVLVVSGVEIGERTVGGLA